jgi:hypothetical protein
MGKIVNMVNIGNIGNIGNMGHVSNINNMASMGNMDNMGSMGNGIIVNVIISIQDHCSKSHNIKIPKILGFLGCNPLKAQRGGYRYTVWCIATIHPKEVRIQMLAGIAPSSQTVGSLLWTSKLAK